MNLLDYFYQHPPKNPKFIDRKVCINGDKIILIGAMGSGKTSLLLRYLQEFKDGEFLYINLEDIRVNGLEFLDKLDEFISQNGIKAVGFDGINGEFKLPKSKISIIISTKNVNFKIKGFEIFKIQGLDYEEFIAFYRKSYEAKTLFSHFLARSNDVKTAFLQDFEINEYLQLRLKSAFDKTELRIFALLANQTGSTFNPYQIYKEIKLSQKISKDKIYECMEKLKEQSYINLISNLDPTKTNKKIYLSDFGLKNALSIKKDPFSTIANMVFCELLKLKSQIYFSEHIDFYIKDKKLAILVVPFLDPMLVFLKFKKNISFYKNLGISKLSVISNSNEENTAIDGIKCEIMPFWQWAVTF